MSDPLLAADQKRREAEQMRTLAQTAEFETFSSIIDQLASAYINQLIQPVPEDWKSHYLRGMVAGLDKAKTLPFQVVRLYDEEKKRAEERPQQDNPKPGIRLSPEPEE